MFVKNHNFAFSFYATCFKEAEKVLREKLTVIYLIKKFTTVYETRRYICRIHKGLLLVLT
jgi:hypothetical protein